MTTSILEKNTDHTAKIDFNAEDTLSYLVNWLNETCEQYPAKQFVLGISGGIDSAVVAHLLARTRFPTTGLILPSQTTPLDDIKDAHLVAQQCNIPAIEIPIHATFETFMSTTELLDNPNAPRQNAVNGNVQARIRMMMLYRYAQNHDAIVVGTDNACEWLMGYFTKFGDGGVDIAPLIHLQKSQVYELAAALSVLPAIINKAPSAGLWLGQTDEDEMGISYADIDAYLRGETISDASLERIKFWHNRSHHKRTLPLIPLPYPHI